MNPARFKSPSVTYLLLMASAAILAAAAVGGPSANRLDRMAIAGEEYRATARQD